MKTKMAFPIVGTLVSFLALAGGAPAPAADSIRIQEFIYGGTGCPQGSAQARVAADGSSFRLLFDEEFVADLGPGVPLPESRKNCQVNLTLQIPQGFTFAVMGVDYRGHARIAGGASGSHKATYYFQGEAEQVSTTRTLNGPFNNDWHFRDQIPIAELVWAPCGIERALNINAQVRLLRGSSPVSSSSSMSMDSERGRLEQIFHLSWRRCTP
jgi:hypothetical protein